MNRQRILVGLLIVVAVTMLPYYFADRAGARLKKEMATIEQEMSLLRDKAVKVKEQEELLAQQERAMADLQKRLISQEPFADMEREVKATAARAGLNVVELNLTGAEPVKELPKLVRYTAAVELSGTTDELIEFIRLLEQHPMLIEVPDLKLGLPSPAPGLSQQQAPNRTRLTLHFYGQAAGQ